MHRLGKKTWTAADLSKDPKVEGRRWLDQAKSDLADAEYLAEGNRFATACFLCQQAAAKALKAVL
jgi:HEPN domain-containing protein